MSEATTIQEVLGILRKTPPPTFDFSRANAKFAKEKRFSVFKRENGLTTGEAIKKDPALLSQPLLTTIMDVTTLMIYFALALAFFPHMA